MNTFTGHGVAARGAFHAAKRAQREWVEGGERGVEPAAYISAATVAAGSTALVPFAEYKRRKPSESKEERRVRLEREALEDLQRSDADRERARQLAEETVGGEGV